MSFYMRRHVEREILSALIDGELEPEVRRYVHEHLQECSDCREASKEFTHVHGLIEDLPRLVAPAAFVSEALKPPRRSARGVAAKALSGRRRWVALGAAGACVAITLSGLVVPPPASEPPVKALIERHMSTHAGGVGADVLFAVNGR